MNIWSYISLIAITGFLYGCGGGSGSIDVEQNPTNKQSQYQTNLETFSNLKDGYAVFYHEGQSPIDGAGVLFGIPSELVSIKNGTGYEPSVSQWYGAVYDISGYTGDGSAGETGIVGYAYTTKQHPEASTRSEIHIKGTNIRYSGDPYKFQSMQVWGDVYSANDLPSSATFEGVHIVRPILPDNVTRTLEPYPSETGSFKMVLDLEAGTGSLVAGTGNTLTSFSQGARFQEIKDYEARPFNGSIGQFLVTSDNVRVDVETGQLIAQDLVFVDYENGLNLNGELHGVLNGNALGVSAIYNVGEMSHVGALSGAREE